MDDSSLEREILRLQRRYGTEQNLARVTNDVDTYRRISHRRKYLSQIAEEIRQPSLLSPSVFVAYSDLGDGKEYFSVAQRVIENAGFEILTGFDKAVRGHRSQNLLTAIRKRISQATLFLGIWTPDYWIDTRMQEQGGMERYRGSGLHRVGVPSVWMPTELGIAVSLGKSFVLMIDSKVHPDFYTKIWGGTASFCIHGRNV